MKQKYMALVELYGNTKFIKLHNSDDEFHYVSPYHGDVIYNRLYVTKIAHSFYMDYA